MTQRFTIDGSDVLEGHLAQLCEQARIQIFQIIPERKIKALLLGGGYGRGEGGVLKTPSGDKPYNDLEFYILLDGSDLTNPRLYARPVHHLAEELTSKAGIEMEFKLLSLRKLERSPVTMFYHDLITGHRLIHGHESWLTHCDQHRAAHRIPLAEATRLLMNRCSGLLYSQEKLARSNFTPEDADFVGRNLAKAKLAFGDVLLALRNQYHWSCRERHKRLRKLEADDALQNFSAVVPLHAQGVEFKLHPVRTTRSQGELQSELGFLKDIGSQLWLTLESRRLVRTFTSIQDYCLDAADKCPETNKVKNRLVNARHFGLSGVLETRYPRERLLNALPLLLWHADEPSQNETRAFLQRQLKTKTDSVPELTRAYEALWRIYN